MDEILKALPYVPALALIAVLLIYVFILRQKSDSETEARRDGMTKQLVETLAKIVTFMGAQDTHLDLIRQDLIASRESALSTTAAHTEAVRQTLAASLTNREILIKQTDAIIASQNALRTVAQGEGQKIDTLTNRVDAALTDFQAKHAAALEQGATHNVAVERKMDTFGSRLEALDKQLETLGKQLATIPSDMQRLLAEAPLSPAQQEAIKGIEGKLDALLKSFTDLRKLVIPEKPAAPVTPEPPHA